jgi:hypothetical protein
VFNQFPDTKIPVALKIKGKLVEGLKRTTVLKRKGKLVVGQNR